MGRRRPGWLFGLFAFVTIEVERRRAVGFRTGPDLDAYLRAGHDLLNGAPVYVGQIGEATNFPYAPPWAVIAAGLGLLPPLLVQAGIIVLDLLAMRYVAGSWRGVGWFLLWPLDVFVISAGNIDLLIAAADRAGLVARAVGGPGRRLPAADRRPARSRASAPLALIALAKLAPALALPPRRGAERAGGAGCAWRHAARPATCGRNGSPTSLRQPDQIAISLPVAAWYWLAGGPRPGRPGQLRPPPALAERPGRGRGDALALPLHDGHPGCAAAAVVGRASSGLGATSGRNVPARATRGRRGSGNQPSRGSSTAQG